LLARGVRSTDEMGAIGKVEVTEKYYLEFKAAKGW